MTDGWVGADHKAQQESYTVIHKHYPIIRANSRNINNNQATENLQEAR